MADLDVAVRLKFLTQGQDQLKGAARALNDFGKASAKLSGSASGRFSGSLTRAWTASAKLGGALDKSASAAARTAGALNRIGAEARDIDRTRAAVDRLAKSTTAADRRLRDARGRFAGGGEGLGAGAAVAAGAAGGATARRRRAMKEGLAEAASRLSPEGYLIGAGGAVIAGAAIGATAATGLGAAALATREAISRNKAFAEIQKKVNLDAGQSWEDLDRKVAKVSTSIGMSYEQAAAIFAQGGQGNVATKDLEGFAMLGAKVATAWDIGAKEAAQMLTEVKGQTRWNNRELETFADKVNFLGDISAAAEKDIGVMWQRASAGAKAAGVTYDDAMVAMTALRGVGMQDEVAARFFGQFSSKLRRASTLSKDAQAAFKELGLSAEGVEQGMQANALQTMVDLLDRLGKAKNPVKIANDIGGGEWFDEILRMKEALPELIRLRDALAKGGFDGSIQKAMDIDLGTTEAKLNRLKQALLDIAAQAAKPIVLPWLDSVSDKWAAAANRWREATQRSAATRAMATPVGESVSAYETRLRLNRAPAPKPMFQQIEGASPHIDVKQIDTAVADGVAKANSLYDALQKLSTTVTPGVNIGPASAAMDALVAKAQATGAAVRAALSSFGAPGAAIRVGPSLTGGRGAGGSTGGGAPAAPAATTPGKQARAGGRGGVQIAQAHFHGVRDARSMYRQLAALEARRIRSSRDAALHDLA
ncbi:phage tail tape measure protein [Methylocystis sp. WRRC1]|uniref:phage tail tape measure protein n=1 Tax=unclassified Methylocystis TaxID=2625913 RepID=UPI000564666B|nr:MULTISPECIES: phage tail tape measure protein [unclassified Methylocystis]MCC3246124.1 phage tail tape measure protein [Methylocystis sp. WRRC1]